MTTFVVLDLVGDVVKHSRITTPSGADPDAVIGTIAAEVKQLIAGSGVEAARIAGLGVASPGPIDLEAGTVVDPPLLPGWHRVPLRDALAAATGLTTLVDKDVTSAAVAETWAGGPSGAGSFIFMYMGTGIGCGIVLNDEVVRGTSGNAGEIGHIVVDPGGAPCDCGQHGCVKSSCIPQVLVAQAQAAGILEPSGVPRTGPTGRRSRSASTQLCAKADCRGRAGRADHRSPPCSWRAPSRDHQHAGRGPCGVRRPVLDLPRPSGTWNGSRTDQERSATRQIHAIEVVGTGVGEDVGAVGAACLVLEHTLAPRSQRLLLEGLGPEDSRQCLSRCLR